MSIFSNPMDEEHHQTGDTEITEDPSGEEAQDQETSNTFISILSEAVNVITDDVLTVQPVQPVLSAQPVQSVQLMQPVQPLKNKCVIVEIHFNSYGFKKERFTKKWIDYRIKIFMMYTCRCLMKQTNKNFKAFIYYADQSNSLIQRALRRYKKLPSNIQFVRISDRDKRVLDCLEGFKHVYFVRVDSDDMYRKNFIAQLHAFKPKPSTKALINQRGFWYDSNRKRLAAVVRNSPPFYTLIFKTEDYKKGMRYPLKGHGSVIRLPHEKFKPRNYMVVIHGKNTSTRYRIRKKTDYRVNRKRIGKIMKLYR